MVLLLPRFSESGLNICFNSYYLFQNSVLGVVLAGQHFGNPLTAVPCAVSSVCHSIFGSALAGIWRNAQPSKPWDPDVVVETISDDL